MESDEQRRIEAAQKDPSRFAALYEEYFERVYAFVARRVRDRHAAQDLTAEVFQKALASLPRYQWRGVPFAAWLYRIASNAVADHFQRLSHEQCEPIVEEEIAADEIARIDERASLHRQVGKLPPDQRRVVVMRFAEDRSIREIAERIGRSEGAVKQLQWRALQTLRAQLGRNDV